jgi:hypothetical protein
MLYLLDVQLLSKNSRLSKFSAQIFSIPTRELAPDLVANGAFCASF